MGPTTINISLNLVKLTSGVQTLFPRKRRAEVAVCKASQVEVRHVVVLLKEVPVRAEVADLTAEGNDRAVGVAESQIICCRRSWWVDASDPCGRTLFN